MTLMKASGSFFLINVCLVFSEEGLICDGTMTEHMVHVYGLGGGI